LAIHAKPAFQPKDYFSEAHFVLFFSVLPLINALFDFASVGLTRYWLRKGLSGNILWNGLRDAVAGLVIFLALGCTIITFIHLVRPQDNVPLLNLASLFDDLAANPGNYWWLFFMVFSTLIPTVTHAGIALFSLFTLAGPRLRNWLAQMFRMGGKGDAHPEWIARTTKSAPIAAAIWAPAFIVIEGLALFPGAVTALIDIFAAFATLISAI